MSKILRRQPRHHSLGISIRTRIRRMPHPYRATNTLRVVINTSSCVVFMFCVFFVRFLWIFHFWLHRLFSLTLFSFPFIRQHDYYPYFPLGVITSVCIPLTVHPLLNYIFISYVCFGHYMNYAEIRLIIQEITWYW